MEKWMLEGESHRVLVTLEREFPTSALLTFAGDHSLCVCVCGGGGLSCM